MEGCKRARGGEGFAAAPNLASRISGGRSRLGGGGVLAGIAWCNFLPGCFQHVAIHWKSARTPDSPSFHLFLPLSW